MRCWQRGGMVTTEDLTALDLLQWLGAGRLVAERLGCNQSTVSRRVDHCARTFGVRLKRINGEWRLQGKELLLAMERQVHQVYRLLGGAPLRLECTAWDAPLLALPPPAGWITGRFDHIGLERPLELLRKRVIDAWISSAMLDLPTSEDGELQVFPLSRFPLWMMAAGEHPLAGEQGLRRRDLESFPSLALPDGMYPVFERELRRRDLWSAPVRMRRYRAQDWEGRCADQVTMSVGNCVGRLFQPDLVPLDWDLELISGQALVVHRDVAEQGAIQLLLELLRRRVVRIRDRDPVLQPL